MKNCKNCGIEFVVLYAERLFCTRKCYISWRKVFGRPELRRRVMLSCFFCHEKFEVRLALKSKRKFCSCSCRAKNNWAINRDKHMRGFLKRPRGKDHERFGKPPRHGKSIFYLSKDGRDMKFRSSWELDTAVYLDNRGVIWDYEPKRFVLKDRTYCPDFHIPDWGVYWEVKGWFHERHQETIRQFRELHPENPIVVIGEQMIKYIRGQNAKQIDSISVEQG